MAAQVVTADTSVIVPSLIRWHALHRRAASAVRGMSRVPAHALAESFSVLTRLPAPQALGPAQAHELLLRSFPDEPLTLSGAGYLATIRRLAEADTGGGRVYDAIIGAAAAEVGACLLTADRRALSTYALVGAAFELID